MKRTFILLIALSCFVGIVYGQLETDAFYAKYKTNFFGSTLTHYAVNANYLQQLISTSLRGKYNPILNKYHYETSKNVLE